MQAFVNTNTEAYAYLLIEQNYDKFVHGGNLKWAGGNRNGQGRSPWEKQALTRYKEICNHVKVSRKEKRTFDENYLLEKKMETCGLQNKAAAAQAEVVEAEAAPEWDLLSNSDREQM